MANLVYLLCSVTGLLLVGAGLGASLRQQMRPGLWLSLAGCVILLAGAVTGRAWPLAAADLLAAAVNAWLLWRNRRRRKRAPRAYGAKSAALLAALTRKARDAARPRPVPRLAPQGAG
jgi:hypothetical protein